MSDKNVIPGNFEQSPNSPLAALGNDVPPRILNVVIVALCGPKGTGKSKFAGRMFHVAPSQSTLLIESFATPLRRRVGWLFPAGWTLVGVPKDEPLTALQGRSVREAMEREGDFVRQTYGNHHLARMWQRQAVEALRREARKPGGKPLVFLVADDLRTAEEAAMIRGQSGFVVELARKGVRYGNTHATDTRLPEHCIDVTWEVPNVEDEFGEALDQSARALLDELMRRRGVNP